MWLNLLQLGVKFSSAGYRHLPQCIYFSALCTVQPVQCTVHCAAYSAVEYTPLILKYSAEKGLQVQRTVTVFQRSFRKIRSTYQVKTLSVEQAKSQWFVKLEL